jgi:hypothetical protein
MRPGWRIALEGRSQLSISRDCPVRDWPNRDNSSTEMWGTEKTGAAEGRRQMKMGSIRSLMTVLGAVGFIAACGSSNNSSTGGFAPVAKKTTGADASLSGNSSGNSSGAGGNDNSGSPGNSSGSTQSGDDSGGACTAQCTVDSDCDTACGTAAGVNCCGSGVCFANASGTCDDEGGAGDDSGSPSPAPSM